MSVFLRRCGSHDVSQTVFMIFQVSNFHLSPFISYDITLMEYYSTASQGHKLCLSKSNVIWVALPSKTGMKENLDIQVSSVNDTHLAKEKKVWPYARLELTL